MDLTDSSSIHARRRAREARVEARISARDQDAAIEAVSSQNFVSSRLRSGRRAPTISGTAAISAGAISKGDQPNRDSHPSISSSGDERNPFLTLDGLADDAKAEELAVNNSPTVKVLTALAERQRENLSRLQAQTLAASFTQLAPHSSPPAEQAGIPAGAPQPADNAVPSTTGIPIAHPPPSEVTKAQIEVSTAILNETLAALREEERRIKSELREAQLFNNSHSGRLRARGSQALSRGAYQARRNTTLQAPLSSSAPASRPAQSSITNFFKSVPLNDRLKLDNERFAKLAAQPDRATQAAIRAALRQVNPARPAPSERQYFRRFDDEERYAVTHSIKLAAEPASQDSIDDRVRTKEGYVHDDFCVPDAFKDLVSEDESASGDDECTSLDSDLDVTSEEEDSEADARALAIESAIQRSKMKAKSGSFVHISCPPESLQQLRTDDIIIKRRTSRTHLVELLLNNWLRTDVAQVKTKHLDEFLRQLRLLPLEYALSVYYALAKRIRPISTSFYKLLFRCVAGYLPDHISVFGEAHCNVTSKERNARATPAHTPTAQPAEHIPVSKRKPTTRAPQIDDINNIKAATGSFYNAYRAYARDWKGFDHKTIFECFTPNQAAECALPAFARPGRSDAEQRLCRGIAF